MTNLIQVLDKDLAIRDVDILPDLHDDGERYSTEDLADAERVIVGNRHECHLVTLRAGVLAAEESVESAKRVRVKPLRKTMRRIHVSGG